MRDDRRELKLEMILGISKFSNWNLGWAWAIELKLNNLIISDSAMGVWPWVRNIYMIYLILVFSVNQFFKLKNLNQIPKNFDNQNRNRSK